MSLTKLSELEQRIHDQKLSYEKWQKEKFDSDNQTVLRMAMAVVELIGEAMAVGQCTDGYVKVYIPAEFAPVAVLDMLSHYYVLQQRNLSDKNNITWFIKFK